MDKCKKTKHEKMFVDIFFNIIYTETFYFAIQRLPIFHLHIYGFRFKIFFYYLYSYTWRTIFSFGTMIHCLFRCRMTEVTYVEHNVNSILTIFSAFSKKSKSILKLFRILTYKNLKENLWIFL